MSETHGAEGAEAETFDLSDVPMDGEDQSGEAGHDDDGGDADEGQGEKKPAKAADTPRAPLSLEEVSQRYDNARTALSEERRERRALQRRLEALESGDAPPARQQQRQARPEPEAEIDPEEDPIGALKQMRAKVKAYEQAEQQDNLTAEQERRQDRQLQAVEAQLIDHEADFRDDNPDYDDAAKHYAVARATELVSFGLEPGQVQKMLRKEFAELTSTAISARKNPAAVIYQLAKGRGFGVKTPPTPDPKKPSRLDALERGQRATSPLARSGGRPSNGLDAETISNINIRDPKGAEAFDKAWEAMERQARRR